MAWFFGAGMGLLLGGPLGAIVGGAIQHFATNAKDAAMHAGGAPNEETVFVTYLVSIMTKIAMADGKVDKDEVLIIHNFLAKNMGYSGLEMRYIDGLIDQTQRVNMDIGMVADSFLSLTNKETCRMLLDICYQVAAADGVISGSEQRELDFLAQRWQMSPEEVSRLHNRYSFAKGGKPATEKKQAAPTDDYTFLGVDRSVSDDEIKKAYRQMASQYHPDKVSHLGNELIVFANNKFMEISKAYDNIKKERGI